MNNLIKSFALIIVLPILAGVGAGFIFYEKYKDVEVTVTEGISYDNSLFKEEEPEIDEEAIKNLQESLPPPTLYSNETFEMIEDILKDVEELEEQKVQSGGKNETELD